MTDKDLYRLGIIQRVHDHTLLQREAARLLKLTVRPVFGPTLACEKLTELHGVTLSKKTVRKLMMQSGLWIPRRHRAPKIQQPRYRRACVGELLAASAKRKRSGKQISSAEGR